MTVFSLFVQQFCCYHWEELLLGILEFIAVFSQRTANLLKLRDNMFTWPWVKIDLCLLTMLHHWEEIKGNLLPQRLLAFFSNLIMLQYWGEIKGKWFTSLFTWPWVKLDLCLLTMLHYWEENKGNLLPQRLLAFFSNLTMLQSWEEIKGKWFTSLSPYYSLSSE